MNNTGKLERLEARLHGWEGMVAVKRKTMDRNVRCKAPMVAVKRKNGQKC